MLLLLGYIILAPIIDKMIQEYVALSPFLVLIAKGIFRKRFGDGLVATSSPFFTQHLEFGMSGRILGSIMAIKFSRRDPQLTLRCT